MWGVFKENVMPYDCFVSSSCKICERRSRAPDFTVMYIYIGAIESTLLEQTKFTVYTAVIGEKITVVHIW